MSAAGDDLNLKFKGGPTHGRPGFAGTLKVVSYNVAFGEEIDLAIRDLSGLAAGTAEDAAASDHLPIWVTIQPIANEGAPDTWTTGHGHRREPG